MATLKSPNSPKGGRASSKKPPRASSSLLRMDMRLPGRVKAELKSGSGGLKGGRAVREFVEKGNIRPVLVQTTRHDTLRRYFEELDKDQSGTLEFHEMRRWLPKIGLDNAEFRESVENHFKFMDKDGSEEVDFKEFALATIDAADQTLSCYEDEQYAAAFGMEIYMFLALCARTKALRSFERDEGDTYAEGNELLPFFQFERLLTVSQSCFMPYELFQSGDSRKEWRSVMGRSALSPQQQAMRSLARESISAVCGPGGGGGGGGGGPVDKGSNSGPDQIAAAAAAAAAAVNGSGEGGEGRGSGCNSSSGGGGSRKDGVEGGSGAEGSGVWVNGSSSRGATTSRRSAQSSEEGNNNNPTKSVTLVMGTTPPHGCFGPDTSNSKSGGMKMGYEDLWGLEGDDVPPLDSSTAAPAAAARGGDGTGDHGPWFVGSGAGGGEKIAREVQRGMAENRRKWAAEKRAQVVAKNQKKKSASTTLTPTKSPLPPHDLTGLRRSQGQESPLQHSSAYSESPPRRVGAPLPYSSSSPQSPDARRLGARGGKRSQAEVRSPLRTHLAPPLSPPGPRRLLASPSSPARKAATSTSPSSKGAAAVFVGLPQIISTPPPKRKSREQKL